MQPSALPYWQRDLPAFAPEASDLTGHYDMIVIGGGFTGLGAARRLAKAGARVAVLEAEGIGSGASGRNGGHLNNGLAHGFLAACQRYGQPVAEAMYRAYDRGTSRLEEIIEEEQIRCDFARAGKLKLASKPAHMAGLAAQFEAIRTSVDPETELLAREDLAGEVGGDAFFGALLQKKSAVMHMGRFVLGLAEAARRHGASVFEETPVTGVKRQSKGHVVETPGGSVTATKVLLATGAYTPSHFRWFRKRIIPVGSFLIATRPLSDSEIALTLPGRRTCVTSMHVGNYFRLSPDNRLIFGGRARFSARSDQRADSKSGAILKKTMTRFFPHLEEVEVEHCWGGLVDMTQDRLPRIGTEDGLFYAMGYSGHGAQIATHLGEVVADRMLGQQVDTPFADLAWPAVPGHVGQPWFLPFVGAYYKLRDHLS